MSVLQSWARLPETALRSSRLIRRVHSPERDRDDGSGARGTVNLDVPALVLHQSITDSQPQARAFAGGFGGKKMARRPG